MSIKDKALAVKAHVVEHKVVYATAGGIVIGVVVTLVIGRKVVVKQQAKNIALVNWKPENHLTQTVVVNLPPRGHRGLKIVNNATGEIYLSQNDAAKKLGVSAPAVAQHLKGLRSSIKGTTLTNFGENLDEQIKLVS